MYGNELGQAIASRRKMGVAIFGQGGALVHCSREGKKQLADSGVCLTDETAPDRYSQPVLDAVRRCFAEQQRSESWVVIGDNAENSVLMSIHFSSEGADGEGVVVGLMRSPGGADWEDDGPRVMEAFGLTRREAQLALHLSAGQDLSEFASGHFLTINTVKTHLKQLFKKMDVNKQIQVAVMVLAALR